MEVDLAVFVQRDVLQQGVALDGVVDIGLGILVQVDDLGIAAALKVEDAVIVPAVLVVADQQALRIGGKGGLAGAGQTEEQGGVLAVHVGVGRAVHRSHALERQVVVHHREHALLHLAAVPGVQDDLLAVGEVEDDGRLRVEAQLLVVLDLRLGGVEGDKVGLEVLELFRSGLDEHVLNEVRLPGHFHDEADGHAGVLVGAAEHVHHIQLLVGKLFDGQLLAGSPGFLAGGLVVVLVLGGGPPHGVLGGLVHNDELVLGGTAGVDAGHHVDGAQFADLALLVAFQAGLGFLGEQLFIRRVVHDLGGAGDTVFGKVNVFHWGNTSLYPSISFTMVSIP